MDKVAVGFWGAFYGMATLMLVLSLAAWLRLHKRVALMAGLTSLFSAAYSLVHMGWLPIEGDPELRLLASVAVPNAVALCIMLLATLGLMRPGRSGPRLAVAMLAFGAAVLGAGWMLPAREAVVLSSASALLLCAGMIALATRAALRNGRMGWAAVAGLVFTFCGLLGLAWIALHREAPWPVHAATAIAGIGYLGTMAVVLWARYSYLIELAEVMAHGPSYDPVTRMRSHSETGQMVGDMFFGNGDAARPVGVIAVAIANVYALENLHGRAASNHALFICAGRLRRSVPDNVEMGRPGDDGFLLLVRSPADWGGLAQLARGIRERLVRPLSLSTSREPADLEGSHTTRAAEVGIGVLATSTTVRPSQAVSTARAMARTAWSYESRLAFYDEASGQIAEMPSGHDGFLSARAA
ncbi:GGDEF domain-containing protein [Ramlibacter terrae]|uniref:GGDEF domain-containing protein n=1 Tax=Ramlibacter terrae TaxID=2732511 RepID=A0ABX6P4P3_9BURK|nr:GGDEF domain-containing protein [Ramlibacter terrae]